MVLKKDKTPRGADTCVCTGEREVQIPLGLKIQMKFKIDSTGGKALMSLLNWEPSIRPFVWFILVSKETLPRFINSSASLKTWFLKFN